MVVVGVEVVLSALFLLFFDDTCSTRCVYMALQTIQKTQNTRKFEFSV